MKQMKILWAVDIFEKNPKTIKSCINFFQALSINTQIKVDAVTVIHQTDYSADQKEVSTLKEKNLELLKIILKKSLLTDWFGKPIILLEKQIPQRVAVLNLTTFSERFDYDAILVVKHSHKSYKPNYLGSFAEMITFLSPIPIFLINPDGFIPKKIEKVLFAIDNNTEKEKDLKKVLNFFPVKNKVLNFIHLIPTPFHYFFKESIKQYKRDQKNIASIAFQSIKIIAENAGAITELKIKNCSNKIAESILSEAKKNEYDLIMTIHRGKEAPGFFLGRITRRILQRADRPVLLFRS